jgi:cytochrome c556
LKLAVHMNLRRSGALRLTAALTLLSALTTASADDKDKDVIAYRQHIMNTLNEQSAALGEILSFAVPDDNVISHLDVLALTASTALKAFTPKVQGGEAKPDVWSNWGDFSKRMNDFARMTAEMAKTAHEQGKEAGLANVVDALSCKSCHDTYRKEKPKQER